MTVINDSLLMMFAHVQALSQRGQQRSLGHGSFWRRWRPLIPASLPGSSSRCVPP